MEKEIKIDRKWQIEFKTAMQVRGLMTNAFEDYIAARNLLLNGFLTQGTILANTAIEKYFKSIKAALNEPIPRHHDITVQKIQNTLKSQLRPIHDVLNQEFLKFLSKAYKLRYIDELEPDFNIAIFARKTLAELDFIVSIFEESVTVEVPKSNNDNTNFKKYINRKDPKLLKENYILNEMDKSEFIKQPGLVYEFRKIPNGEYLQIYYSAQNVKNDGVFNYEAVKPQTDYPCKSFSLIIKDENRIKK